MGNDAPRISVREQTWGYLFVGVTA